ncbi:MAG: pknB 3 [Planctomycetaceae bacterium]|nr:pknB 3 [Planctomycetaceae bacterium]
MSDEQRIQKLVEEILNSNRTEEEVCADDPELLRDVRERFQQCRSLQAEIDAIFPTSGALPPGAVGGSRQPAAELPQIPGYEVEAEVGHGGMGVVYKARHLKLDRLVAIKMLLAGAYASPSEIEQFLREARAIANLCHTNIVQVFDVGEFEGRPYFTMELLESGNLAQKSAGAPQPAPAAATLVAVLAQAVQFAHQHGIVHRDLKPANILLSEDGTPKISDFGLARQVAADADLTLTGMLIGTPSYMAPEQSRGSSDAVAPAVDIYALGALLYEMLTGRPPFRADSAAETARQVIEEEPAPPSRLNAKVPLDLETICLKCLQKDPQRRYTTAVALAEDLQRFLDGQPILARPVGRVERIVRWMRRKPTATALIITALLLMGVALGASVREWRFRTLQQTELERWSDRLAFALRLQQEGRFSEARAILHKADVASDILRLQVERARVHLDLVERLDAIRLSRGNFVPGGGIDYAQSSREYEAIFRQAGLGAFPEDPEGVAERLSASPIRKALIAALDDWSTCAVKQERDWVLSVTRRMDPDPWRDKVRATDAWTKMELLPDLAATVNVDEQPVNLMASLGTRWRRLGGDPTAFLQRVQRRHPSDFWVNFELGYALDPRDRKAAIGFFRAALAIRPNAAVVHYNLGVYLDHEGDLDDAIHHFEQALEIDPNHAWAHYKLGSVLVKKGQLSGVVEHLQKALALDPQDIDTSNLLRSTLVSQGHLEEARVFWRLLLDANPTKHDDWDGYAELCLFLDQEAEYHWTCRELLKRFGATTDPYICDRTGRACLLSPASEHNLRDAAALIDRALTTDKSQYEAWAYRYFQFAKALAEYREHRFDSAITILQSDVSIILGPSPKLVMAMAQYRLGKHDEARRTFARAVCNFDWRAVKCNNREVWLYHLLRREAERLMLPSLQAFLNGTHQPVDNDERLALLGACAFKNLTRAQAGLYVDALTADPGMANDVDSQQRYKAACIAALVGCGRGKDAASLSQNERSRWRHQSREWLRDDLSSWRNKLESNPGIKAQVQTTLTGWQGDADLAGLRETGELVALPEVERQECRRLWSDVTELLKKAQQVETTPSTDRQK